MPILDVLVVGDILNSGGELARQLADGAGEILKSGKHQTWIRLHVLPREGYAENGGGPEEGVHPVFVRVLKRYLPDREALKLEIQQLTRLVASACGRAEENVHIMYDAPAAGRVAFGGRLIE